MATAAPACKAALAEASRLWPRRRTTSDGILSSSAHQRQNPSSDHDYGRAWDLSHDPASGCDAHALVRAIVARRDPRVKYAISNRRIWSAARASEGWRPYSGSNPHTSHAHVSIYAGAVNDTRSWFRGTAPVPAPAPTTKEEWPMPPTLSKGAPAGGAVRILRALLMAAGHKLSAGVDGHFGDGLEEQVRIFQRNTGLSVDGQVGPKTWDRLIHGAGPSLW